MKKIIINIAIISTILCTQNSFGMLLKRLAKSNNSKYSTKTNGKYTDKAKKMHDAFKTEEVQANTPETTCKNKKTKNIKYAGLSALFGGGSIYAIESIISDIVSDFSNIPSTDEALSPVVVVLGIGIGALRSIGTYALAGSTLLTTGIFSRNAFKNHMLSKTLSNAKNKKESLIQTYTDISSQEHLSTEDISRLNDLEVQIQDSPIIKDFTKKI